MVLTLSLDDDVDNGDTVPVCRNMATVGRDKSAVQRPLIIAKSNVL